MNYYNTPINNPFVVVSDALQYAFNGLFGFEFSQERGRESREAMKQAFNYLEQVSKNPNSNLVKKIDQLSSKKLSLMQQDDFTNEFKDLIKTKEAQGFEKLFKKIPKNQRKVFLKEMFVRISTRLVGTRNYIAHSLNQTTTTSKIERLNALDQSIFQLYLLSEKVTESLSKKQDKKLEKLTNAFLILSLNTKWFTSGKITTTELYKTMSFANEEIKIVKKEQKQYKEYLLALTN